METVQIYYAILIILCSLAVGYRRSLRRNGRFALIDVGVWWLAFLAIYSIQPILYWLVTGQFQTVATNRLHVLGTSATDVAQILIISASYAIGFVLTYFHITRFTYFKGGPEIAKIRNSVVFPTLIIFFFLWLLIQFVFPGSSTGMGYESKFLAISELSLGTRRLHKFALGCLVISGAVLLVAMSQRKNIRILALVLIPALVLLASLGGSRGTAFQIMVVFLVAWHALVRPIPRTAWISFAVFGILAFNLFGAIRSHGRLPEGLELVSWLAASGEFEHIFGNAVALVRKAEYGDISVPPTTRFAELYAFVPSEFFGFEKDSLANWFITSFYPELKSSGGGLAFGIFAQAVIGGGAIEALIRGVLLGIVLGYVCKLCVKHRSYWWAFPFYVFFLVRIFDSVRSTTFSFLSDVIQILIPFIVFLCALSPFFRINKPSFEIPQNTIHPNNDQPALHPELSPLKPTK